MKIYQIVSVECQEIMSRGMNWKKYGNISIISHIRNMSEGINLIQYPCNEARIVTDFIVGLQSLRGLSTSSPRTRHSSSLPPLSVPSSSGGATSPSNLPRSSPGTQPQTAKFKPRNSNHETAHTRSNPKILPHFSLEIDTGDPQPPPTRKFGISSIDF